MNKNDILYVEVVKRKIVIHTENKVYTGCLTKQLEILLRCFGFERANSGQYVHIDKIIRRDKKVMAVYFDADKKRACYITRPHIKKFFW